MPDAWAAEPVPQLGDFAAPATVVAADLPRRTR